MRICCLTELQTFHQRTHSLLKIIAWRAVFIFYQNAFPIKFRESVFTMIVFKTVRPKLQCKTPVVGWHHCKPDRRCQWRRWQAAHSCRLLIWLEAAWEPNIPCIRLRLILLPAVWQQAVAKHRWRRGHCWRQHTPGSTAYGFNIPHLLKLRYEPYPALPCREDGIINLPHVISFCHYGEWRYGRHRIRGKRIGETQVYGAEEVLSAVLRQSYWKGRTARRLVITGDGPHWKGKARKVMNG